MFVTKLIKDKKYRQFILTRFPKPQGTKTAESLIKSSSIIGNAFEIYFKLIISAKTESKIDFDEELSTAQSNLSMFERNERLISDQKGVRIVYINGENLKDIRKLVTATFEKDTYKFIRTNGISRIEVLEINPLKIFVFQKESNLQVMNSFHGNSFTIYCKDDIIKMLTNEIDRFKKEAQNYTLNSSLSTDLLSTILQIANISNKYFTANPVFPFFSKTELRELRDSINKINNPFAQMNFLKVFFKPRLTWQKVRARPDFILDSSVLELKSGKEYLSTDDYLQGITYLLFSYQSATQQEYGKINKLQIYYPFIARIFEIDAASIKLNRKDQIEYKKLVVNFYSHGSC